MRNRGAVLIAAIWFSGFAAPSILSKDVEGQIFIVTAGAQAIKLPLVQLKVVSTSELEKHIREVDAQITPERAKADSAARKSTEELQSARSAVAGGFGRWMMSLQKTKSKDPTGQSWADPRTEALRYNAIEKRIPKLEANADNAVTRRKLLHSATPYFDNLPEPIATAKTDADGRFKVSVPDEGEFVLVANSTRQVFRTTENYFWMVRLKSTDSNITLSNDNLTSSGSSDSIIATKE